MNYKCITELSIKNSIVSTTYQVGDTITEKEYSSMQPVQREHFEEVWKDIPVDLGDAIGRDDRDDH